ncbi:MAG: VirB4 family type IV secretion system protein [Paracoccaceae bacterium]
MLDVTKSLPEDPAELRAYTALLLAEVQSQAVLMAKLRQQLAGQRAHRFGPSSEASEQLQLALEMTITVFAGDQAALDTEVARIGGIAHQNGMRLVREVTALEAAFFAMHPGFMDYRARDMTVSSLNFADMAVLHAADTGTDAARLPWQTPLTLFQTLQGSLHRFSFHEPGDPKAEPTNGHTLVSGKSGGGKTTTVVFLAAQAQRAGGRTIIFDKEAGLKMAVRALGGRDAEIRAGRPTGLNPLATESGKRGEAWFLDLLVALLEQRSGPMTPLQSEALKFAISQNGKAREGLRNFRAFQELFGDLGDGLDLAQRISEWGPEGRYGWVFGEAEEPVVDFTSSDVTAVDLTETLDLGTERTAILGYLFRRIEMLIEEKRPTLILIDEAWKVLDDEYFAKKLAEWLVTARKKNVVVVMMTQFPSQIRGSKARSILEALPNQLLFPNGQAASADYDGFRLTDGELDFVLSPIPGQRMVLSPTPRILITLDAAITSAGRQYFEATAGAVGPIYTTLLALLLVMVGINAALNVYRISMREAVQLSFRIVMVLMFGSTWSNFTQIYEAASNGLSALALEYFRLGGGGVGASATAAMDDMANMMAGNVDSVSSAMSSIMRGFDRAGTFRSGASDPACWRSGTAQGIEGFCRRLRN